MRVLKKILLFLALIVGGVILLVYLYCQMQKPIYSGTHEIPDLDSTVTTYFDAYGIPHIYGNSEKDVFRVLGYLHAKERLFQMELIRRVSSGRLSEIFGSKTLETDKFFRMLGIDKRAQESERTFMQNTNVQWKQDVLAYVEGVNEFIEKRRKKIEFLLLDIPKEKFSVKDVYLIVDFMAYNFQMGFRSDILMSRLGKEYGEKYLEDLGVRGNFAEVDTGLQLNTDSLLSFIDNLIPIKIWSGSNAWAVSAERSTSGKTLLENDTHIGLQQPAVWYEAHLECPTFSFYGSFLAGFPFPPMGHNREIGWGLTILENDDLDFFAEHISSEDSSLVLINGQTEKITSRQEIIKVKDSSDIVITCRSTPHGPVCSDVMPQFASVTSAPVTACWTFLKFPDNLPEVTWKMSHAHSMSEFREAVSMIAAPGFNIVYADAADNIAWYTAAKFVRRKPGINPNVILDGSGQDDWLGFHEFSDNPMIENPSRGVVLSANNPPLTDSLHLFPGYYLPEDRYVRINQFFLSKRVFSIKDMQKMNTDETNIIASQIVQDLLKRMSGVAKLRSQIHERGSEILDLWNGSHNANDVAPVIYYKWLYHILHGAFADELGETDFESLLKTHALKSVMKSFLKNDTSLWWDDISTKNKTETNSMIIDAAYDKTINELIVQFGPNPEKWIWKKVHTLEIEHVLGKQKPLNRIFNIGPYPVRGGMETVNNQSFDLNKTGYYRVNLAPAMRRSVDFGDPENAWSVLPSGQSGNFMSRYYNDQIKLFINGKVRKEMMNRSEILNTYDSRLDFIPQR